VTKSNAWATIHFSLMVLALGAHWIGASKELWPAIVAAIVGNGATFFAGQVVDNGVKGAYYRPELDK